jgi:hypothetical protein
MMDARDQIRVIVRYISTRAEEVYHQVLQAGRISIHGATSPVDIAAATDLENYGFVFRRTVPAGYDLLPTPFAILIPSLLHRLDWSYPPFAEVSTDERQRLRTDLIQLRANTPMPISLPLESPEMSRTLEGAADIDAFVASILRQTQDVRAVSAAEWSTNLPLVWTVLVQRMREGMQYRRIVSPLGLAAFGWHINERDTTETGVDLRVSLTPTLSPFYLFTGGHLRSALVFVLPVRDDTQPRATYTALGQLTERLSEMFDDLWRTAVPVRRILDRLWRYRPVYIEHALHTCGEAGARVASVLFDKGIFAELAAEDEAILPCFADSGLAVRSKYTIGLTQYVPNIIEEITRYVREEGFSNDDRNV